MQTRAQCRIHRDITLKLFASRVQQGKFVEGGQATSELVMVVEPCPKCIFDAKKRALTFAYDDMRSQALDNLEKMEGEDNVTP